MYSPLNKKNTVPKGAVFFCCPVGDIVLMIV